MNQDTICALATANGVGALGIIRISGEKAIDIAAQCLTIKDFQHKDSHTVHYGYFVEPRGESQESRVKSQEPRVENQESRAKSQELLTDNRQPTTTNQPSEIIDEVMVSLFRAPKTFTTEDLVEISFHGSPHIAKRILEVLLKNGCRMAKAGEFTMRAFLGGRIDLAQAESIADLIAAENEASRKVALNQLKGGISNEIGLLRNDLLNFTSLIELELDFAEEDVEFADRSAMLNLIENLKSKIQNLTESFQYGNAIKNGIAVAIIGKPNAGKSTLLNALLKEERAIVSDIAGTTRDTIEEVLHIEGNAFRLIDTAGLRDTADQIEAIGVEKAKEKVAQADILVYLIDSHTTDLSEDIAMLNELMREGLKTIVCYTKSVESQETRTRNQEPRTKSQESRIKSQESRIKNQDPRIKNQEFLTDNHQLTTNHQQPTTIAISAKEGIGLDELKRELLSYVESLKTNENSVIITNQRHYEALRNSLDSINKVHEAITSNISTELLAYELRHALDNLGLISGEVTNDEVLGNIFSKFCIGK